MTDSLILDVWSRGEEEEEKEEGKERRVRRGKT